MFTIFSKTVLKYFMIILQEFKRDISKLIYQQMELSEVENTTNQFSKQLKNKQLKTLDVIIVFSVVNLDLNIVNLQIVKLSEFQKLIKNLNQRYNL